MPSHRIREKFQASSRGNGGIEDANRACGGVARIHENLSATLLLQLVHRFKRFARHENFAADFEARRQLQLLQCGQIHAQRDRADRLYVRSHILAGSPIASRHASRQAAIFVLQRNAESIELMLRDVLDLFAAASLAHAPVEIAQLIVGECIVQAQHWPRVLHGLESGARAAANANGGRIGRDQLRVRRLQFLEALHQTVIGGVGNFRLVQNVIEILVMAQLVAQLFDFVFGGYSLGHETLGRTFTGICIILYRMDASRRR